MNDKTAFHFLPAPGTSSRNLRLCAMFSVRRFSRVRFPAGAREDAGQPPKNLLKRSLAAPALNGECGVKAALQSSKLKVSVRFRLLAPFILNGKPRLAAMPPGLCDDVCIIEVALRIYRLEDK